MKRIILLILGFGLGCLLIFLTNSPAGAAALPAAPAAPFAKPINGWRVCGDLGEGSVPGFGVVRERFRLCQGDGWEVLAYCLEVGKTSPPINTLCSYTSNTNVWCGDAFQYLQEYGVLATAAPTPVPTNTATATRTATATFTATFTHTLTATFTRTTTATLTRTITPAASLTSTPLGRLQGAAATATRSGGGGGGEGQAGGRTRPGGSGNLAVITPAVALAALTLLAASLAWNAVRKIRQRSKDRS